MAGTITNVSDQTSRGSSSPPPGTLRLWTEVANGIDKSQTVVWKNAVDSLEEASRYFLTNADARGFVEGHMRPVISILLEQQPSKIGQMEKNCVEESLRLAVAIVAEDLKSKSNPAHGECMIIDVLAMVFNRKKIFYKGSKPSWNVSLIGLPEVRQHTIHKFRSLRGFTALATYLGNRVYEKKPLPSHDVLHQLINATVDAIPLEPNSQETPNTNINNGPKMKNIEDDALYIAESVMEYMRGASEESLKRQAHESLNTLRNDVQKIFEKLAPTRRKEVYAFYEFWRGLTLKLITSQSLPLKLFGWEQVGELIEASSEMRPPPKAFIVSGAGCTFVNGEYLYAGPLTDDGFARHGSEISYVRRIPVSFSEKDGGGKTLTLFRCTMRSHQKWWFLSEADEEQPGTDKDIDYYSHKSKAHEESEPPHAGWTTCRNSGIDPPPFLCASGIMVPPGEELNTLEHQLAKWAIDNKIIELIFGDSVHREIVSRSTPLIKFLASMCEKEENISKDSQIENNSSPQYCLQSSHLLLAWRNCTSKADTAVSAEIYQLLVSILPSLQDNLAIHLLSTVQESLRNSTFKHDYLFEVAEFCAALASANNVEVDTTNNSNVNNVVNYVLSDRVRAEVLNLLWEILSHPEASNLKSYDRIKGYVTTELRVEPMGRTHRERFLGHCKVSLKKNSLLDGTSSSSDCVDEVVALRVVKLTRFILEACPRDHATYLVTAPNSALTELLFKELTAYMIRRSGSNTNFRKPNISTFESSHPSALSERFNILRFAYGLSEVADMSTEHLDYLWFLCANPSDRESLMIFLASASCINDSNNIPMTGVESYNNDTTIQQNASSLSAIEKPSLTTAFSERLRHYIFQNLFCSNEVDWEKLGEGAYQSFQMFFKTLRQNNASSPLDAPAVNALWRICLCAGSNEVANHAMKDLLAVYSELGTSQISYVDPTTDEVENLNLPPDKIPRNSKHVSDIDMLDSSVVATFAERVFQCLVQVKEDLIRKSVSAERSAERCLKILNSAVGQDYGISGQRTSDIAILALKQLDINTSLNEALRLVPHGMRGQSSYQTVAIVAKRVPSQTPGNSSSNPDFHMSSSGTLRSSTNQEFYNTSPGSLRNANQGFQNSSSNGLVVSSKGFSSSSTSSQISNLRQPSVVRFSLSVHPLETLLSIKKKIATFCHHRPSLVRPTSITGRQSNYIQRFNPGVLPGESNNYSLNSFPEDSTVLQLGIIDGCEIIVFLATSPMQTNHSQPNTKNFTSNMNGLDLSVFFEAENKQGFADEFFNTLLSILEVLPSKENEMRDTQTPSLDSHKLVWDLLLAMPTNTGIVSQVQSAAAHCCNNVPRPVSPVSGDKMVLDSSPSDIIWPDLININNFHRAVYVLQVIDSLLQPAPEILSSASAATSMPLQRQMLENAAAYRKGFIDSGGFESVLSFFTKEAESELLGKSQTRMGNAVALRVLKCSFFGYSNNFEDGVGTVPAPDEIGKGLLANLTDPDSLLFSLSNVVVSDPGVTDSAILDVLLLLRHLFLIDPKMTKAFASLPNHLGEKLVTTLLLWECAGTVSIASVNASTKVRRSIQDLILAIPSLSKRCFPWLVTSLNAIDNGSDAVSEFFAVLKKVVEDCSLNNDSEITTKSQLQALATAVCIKLASHPSPTSDSAIMDFSTGVLCGCFELIRALIESGGGAVFLEGSKVLTNSMNISSWSRSGSSLYLSPSSQQHEENVSSEEAALFDLMGAIFDGFLSSAGSSTSTAICFDKVSRQLGFEVIAAAARSARGNHGYFVLVNRVMGIINLSSPALRHLWSYNASFDDGNTRNHGTLSKYSGLRNQGCTCYMNSVLQQLFMMPDLRKILCTASLPSSLRSTGSGVLSKGSDLVGKRISIHWESGVSYEAIVENFDDTSGMHIVRYMPLPINNTGQGHHQPQHQNHNPQIRAEDLAAIPDELPEEFILSEGRPGKETGVFDVINSDGGQDLNDNWNDKCSRAKSYAEIEETEEEASARRLLEEVQRTFVHLQEGSRGRCFDPRSLVEASGCLKLEFDVWQQNDASEYAMKLLDRLELPLKRWAPSHFKYLTNTFGLKQTKQKICKECGLKTNREENLMNIDCQIRGKADIHEALSTMCEVEFMEGDNKVFCDRCKEKRDTVLRTAISALPNVLILSLKRFDLDYTTFETVKLNSRCAFGQTLNMKKYTLEGVEAVEKFEGAGNDAKYLDAMDTDGEYPIEDPLNSLPDIDYEYKLVGVLVHAGVAQGGHYYSFIKDRLPTAGEEIDRWYRFDDEDVSHFDPSSIEVECFGGKVKKETKWPNGQVHTVESEQFANALMLFYEKVKPVDILLEDEKPKQKSLDDMEESSDGSLVTSSGYDVFQPDVRRSNATHCWHNFLFDAEFQTFLKGLLGLCLLQAPDIGDNSNEQVGMLITDESNVVQWHLLVLQTCISFVFDILLHSSDRDSLSDWLKRIKSALTNDKLGAKWFVHELARRTHNVSSNWLRVYCLDCPEKFPRQIAISIFSSAIRSCITLREEQSALRKWSSAWKSQVETHQKHFTSRRQNSNTLPTMLEGALKAHENIEMLDSSSIGILLSTLSGLIEVAPQTQCHNSDFSILLRELSTIDDDLDFGSDIFRLALIEAQFPARLIAFLLRDRAPQALKVAFPGASLPYDIAEALVKNETPPTSHLMPLAGGAVGVGGVGNNSTNAALPTQVDRLNILVSLGCILQVPGVKLATLICESDAVSKGRSVFSLTSLAQSALTTIFKESKSSHHGMGQRDIQNYMQKCGMDTSVVPQQKIASILSKYPSTSVVGNDSGKESRYLTLEGFLAYYRDTAQTNETQVRSDLHTFGYRLDLSRRAESTRFFSHNGNQHCFENVESVALDVSFIYRDKVSSPLGFFAETGLQCYNLYSIAFSTSEPLAENLLTAVSYSRDTDRLIIDTLKHLIRAPNSWGGSDILSSCTSVLKALAAIPDTKQNDRITTMMQTREKIQPHSEAGVGILVAAKDISPQRAVPHYSNEYHYSLVERYIAVTKELHKIRKVQEWMRKNREQWLWMEQWIRTDGSNQQQIRNDFSNRESIQHQASPISHPHSDSEMNTGLEHDSDEEDDDDNSRYDHVQNSPLASKVIVRGAGVDAVNGTYVADFDPCDNVGKYSKEGVWKGHEEMFSLFRCQLSDNTRRWYISIVPRNHVPGTNKDIDFYSAPAGNGEKEIPPEIWSTTKEGLDPAPTCVWKANIKDEKIENENYENEHVGEGRDLNFL